MCARTIVVVRPPWPGQSPCDGGGKDSVHHEGMVGDEREPVRTSHVHTSASCPGAQTTVHASIARRCHVLGDGARSPERAARAPSTKTYYPGTTEPVGANMLYGGSSARARPQKTKLAPGADSLRCPSTKELARLPEGTETPPQKLFLDVFAQCLWGFLGL